LPGPGATLGFPETRSSGEQMCRAAPAARTGSASRQWQAGCRCMQSPAAANWQVHRPPPARCCAPAAARQLRNKETAAALSVSQGHPIVAPHPVAVARIRAIAVPPPAAAPAAPACVAPCASPPPSCGAPASGAAGGADAVAAAGAAASASARCLIRVATRHDPSLRACRSEPEAGFGRVWVRRRRREYVFRGRRAEVWMLRWNEEHWHGLAFVAAGCWAMWGRCVLARAAPVAPPRQRAPCGKSCHDPVRLSIFDPGRSATAPSSPSKEFCSGAVRGCAGGGACGSAAAVCSSTGAVSFVGASGFRSSNSSAAVPSGAMGAALAGTPLDGLRSTLMSALGSTTSTAS
jgi:hypothetical protein